MQPLTRPYVYGVNRSQRIFSFCQISGVPEADIKVYKFVLFWAVYSILFTMGCEKQDNTFSLLTIKKLKEWYFLAKTNVKIVYNYFSAFR